ncbi:uncharacterized protein METZ01_LOCUS1988, partial [marine metagenome]
MEKARLGFLQLTDFIHGDLFLQRLVYCAQTASAFPVVFA